MHVSRLLLHNFRGWAALDFRPQGHVLLAGVPRAGRTDIVAALARVLDPQQLRTQPAISDIRQQRATAPTSSGAAFPLSGGDPDGTATDRAEMTKNLPAADKPAHEGDDRPITYSD